MDAENAYRLCDLRGPSGIIVALAEQLGQPGPYRRDRTGVRTSRSPTAPCAAGPGPWAAR